MIWIWLLSRCPPANPRELTHGEIALIVLAVLIALAIGTLLPSGEKR